MPYEAVQAEGRGSGSPFSSVSSGYPSSASSLSMSPVPMCNQEYMGIDFLEEKEEDGSEYISLMNRQIEVYAKDNKEVKETEKKAGVADELLCTQNSGREGEEESVTQHEIVKEEIFSKMPVRTDRDKAEKGGDESDRSAPHKEMPVNAQVDCDEEVPACSAREAWIRGLKGEVQITTEVFEQEGSNVQNTGKETRREQSPEDKCLIEQSVAGKDREMKSSKEEDTDIKRSEEDDRGYKSTEEEDRAMPNSEKEENKVHSSEGEEVAMKSTGQEETKILGFEKRFMAVQTPDGTSREEHLTQEGPQRLQVLGEGSQGDEEESKATQRTLESSRAAQHTEEISRAVQNTSEWSKAVQTTEQWSNTGQSTEAGRSTAWSCEGGNSRAGHAVTRQEAIR